MRKLLSVLVVVVALALGTTIAVATNSGGSHHQNGAANAQYKVKPGCGPDKTDGVAGNSGRHEGQPPKADDRQDCPNPPGQQGNTNPNSSTSSSSSIQSSGGNGNNGNGNAKGGKGK